VRVVQSCAGRGVGEGSVFCLLWKALRDRVQLVCVYVCVCGACMLA
jgi:hypothetical protein